MSSKYALVVVFVMAALLMSGLGRDTAQADTDLLTDIEFTPDPAIAGEPIDFSVKLTDETDVDSVFLNMCSSLFCFPPKAMVKGTGGAWTATSTDVIDPGEYHFNITVVFTNGSRVWNDDIYFDAYTTTLDSQTFEHSPAKVRIGEEVDVYFKPAEETGISSLVLYHCRGDVCFNPITMTKLTNGTWHARIGPFDTKEEIKVNVTASYEDGHTAWTQDLAFSPAKKSSDGDDDSGLLPAMGGVAVLAVLTGLAVSRRGRRGPVRP